MTTPRVAVIDDEPVVCREIRRFLEKDRYVVETFLEGEPALQRMSQAPFDLVLCDLRLPGKSGLDVLRQIKADYPLTEVILITAYRSMDAAVEAIQAGAFHFVTKPVKGAEIRSLTNRALEKTRLVREKDALKEALFSGDFQREMVGRSAPMQEVFRLIEKVAPLTCNVLIQGESGTGKEMVARAIHLRGSRRDHPFVSFNCGGFTEELIANELFGHERGAFTGAVERKIGLLEAADQGTIFLDEIGEMPSSMQVKLLRFVQERTLRRVGGVKPLPVDVRILAASNQELGEAVKRGTFRQDLYYRLNVVKVSLPPLRVRRDDIPSLALHFLSKYGASFGKKMKGFEPETLEILLGYPFPGNVRELENIVERSVALAEGSSVRPQDLPSDLQQLSIRSVNAQAWPSLEEKEREYIQQVLAKADQNKRLAAQILKVPRTTLWRKMKKLGLA
jgi:two-component system, NtrC family, response regulator AtoC